MLPELSLWHPKFEQHLEAFFMNFTLLDVFETPESQASTVPTVLATLLPAWLCSRSESEGSSEGRLTITASGERGVLGSEEGITS